MLLQYSSLQRRDRRGGEGRGGVEREGREGERKGREGERKGGVRR